MPYIKIFIMMLLGIFLCHYSKADKIDKKGTLLNAKCNPIGTQCKTSIQTELIYTYIFNEPKKGSFSLSVSAQELLKNPLLHQAFMNKKQFILEESMIIPDDVIQILLMPVAYTVQKGIYPLNLQNGIYTIVFKD
ncbi:MAG: hypothetical protein IPF62_02125 [Bacteroidetes bacterium]|nr:hypothetical protein [Bacteroidota bacterium]